MPINAPLSTDMIGAHNAAARAVVEEDYDALGRVLARRGVDIDAVKAQAKTFSMALPTWGSGVGGTRFARFPITG